ncbi:MAG: hypothetical protein ACFFCB_03900, partial [Candidatus Odinarchaeota archaeon]
PPIQLEEIEFRQFQRRDSRTQTARKLTVRHETVKNQEKAPKYADEGLLAWWIQQSWFQTHPWAALDSSC